MFHIWSYVPYLNTNNAYKITRRSLDGRGIEISNTDLSTFIQNVNTHLDAASRSYFTRFMNTQIGPNSTYTLKREVLESLHIIHERFSHLNTPESEKTAIALKLYERAAKCATGFHDGVNDIVEGFSVPDNIDELLYHYRRDITDKTANKITDEVHARNRVFTIAARLRYGIRPLNKEDVYRGALSDISIERELRSNFKKSMRLFSVLQGLEEQVLGQLTRVGYLGSTTNVSPNIQEKIDHLLLTIFHEHPVAQNLQNNLNSYKSQSDAYNEEIQNILDEIKDFIQSHPEEFPNFHQHQEAKTTYLLTDTGLPLFKKWATDGIHKLSTSDQAAFAEIKSRIPHFDIRVREQLNDATLAFNQLFFIQNTEQRTQNIHCKNIRYILWQAIKKQAYFRFVEDEATLLNELMNPSLTQDEYEQHLLSYLKTIDDIDDIIDILSYRPKPLSDYPIAILNEYFAKKPMTYDCFKKLVNALDDCPLRVSLIDDYYSVFLAELQQDQSMPLSLIAKMPTVFAKNFLYRKFKSANHHSIRPLFEALLSCNAQIINHLAKQDFGDYHLFMLAAYYSPMAVQAILDCLQPCPNDIKIKIWTKLSHRSQMNMLMHAVIHQPQAVQPMLNFLSTCTDEIKHKVLTQQSYQTDSNVLMLAVKYKPQSIQVILHYLSTCNDDIKHQILTQKNSKNENVITQIVRYHPQHTQVFLDNFPLYNVEMILGLSAFLKNNLTRYAQLDLTRINATLKVALLKNILEFEIKGTGHHSVQALANLLKNGLNQDQPQSYFNANLDEFKHHISLLQKTAKSLLNSALNIMITVLLTLSVVGLPLVYCLNILNKNKTDKGHSLMFFTFGEKQTAQVLHHQTSFAIHNL